MANNIVVKEFKSLGSVVEAKIAKVSPSGPDQAAIMRLYQAYFGRYPDVKGANFWLNSGMSLKAINHYFAGSLEFKLTYSNMDDESFVEQIYNNVLNRASDPIGKNFWVGMLEEGIEMSRGRLVELFSDSIEFRSHFPYVDSEFYKFSNTRGKSELIAPGVAYRKSRYANANTHVTYIDLEAGTQAFVSPGTSKDTVGTFALEKQATVSINANWYTARSFDGWSIANRILRGGKNHGYTAFFGFGDGQVGVEEHGSVIESPPDWIREAISGHPTLVWDGKDNNMGIHTDPTVTWRHPRTAIGLSEDGKYVILVVVDGRTKQSRGMTGKTLSEYMLHLGSHYAIMLDGGGSSTMWVNGKVVNRPSDFGRARKVGNELVFTPGVFVK